MKHNIRAEIFDKNGENLTELIYDGKKIKFWQKTAVYDALKMKLDVSVLAFSIFSLTHSMSANILVFSLFVLRRNCLESNQASWVD